jgi:hypothetical protein
LVVRRDEFKRDDRGRDELRRDEAARRDDRDRDRGRDIPGGRDDKNRDDLRRDDTTRRDDRERVRNEEDLRRVDVGRRDDRDRGRSNDKPKDDGMVSDVWENEDGSLKNNNEQPSTGGQESFNGSIDNAAPSQFKEKHKRDDDEDSLFSDDDRKRQRISPSPREISEPRFDSLEPQE